ncbi:MAG: dephospho-CoA kinase [Pseudohongiellaceae bacterium]
MFVVGLTGGIGSGKTTVADLFGARGVDIIDADVVAREVVMPGSRALVSIGERFGADALNADGSLNRRWLREQVFADPAQRQWLEALLHPLVGQRIRALVRESTAPYCLLVAPLLLEGNLHEMVNRVLIVDAPEALQLERTLARDGGDRDTVSAIMAAQLPRQERLARADDVLDNSGDLEELVDKVARLHESYSRRARNHD